TDAPFVAPTPLTATIGLYAPTISLDGQHVVFTAIERDKHELQIVSRTSKAGAFGSPTALRVNSTVPDATPHLTSKALYFSSQVQTGGGSSAWHIHRADFSNGKVGS